MSVYGSRSSETISKSFLSIPLLGQHMNHDEVNWLFITIPTYKEMKEVSEVTNLK